MKDERESIQLVAECPTCGSSDPEKLGLRCQNPFLGKDEFHVKPVETSSVKEEQK